MEVAPVLDDGVLVVRVPHKEQLHHDNLDVVHNKRPQQRHSGVGWGVISFFLWAPCAIFSSPQGNDNVEKLSGDVSHKVVDDESQQAS